jgi:hypothetical protein
MREHHLEIDVASLSFTVTAAGQKVNLDASGAAQAPFTVTNTSPQTLRGRLLTRPNDPAKAEWLSIVGESTRDFAPNAAEQVVVQLNVPPTAPPGTYSFRLDAVSEVAPDEDFTEGPSVAFDVAPPPPMPKKKFPWLAPLGLPLILWEKLRQRSEPQPSPPGASDLGVTQPPLNTRLRDAALAGVVRTPTNRIAEEKVTGQVERDIVQCTVFAPPSSAAGDSILVQVFVHLPEEADDARAVATELDVDARRRAFHSLDAAVRVGARLDFELRLPGLHVDDPVASLVWRRRTEAVQFGVAVPAKTPERTLIGTVSVSVDSVPVGHVKFKLAITQDAAERQSEPQGEEARRYRFAFISYSSNDRSEVMRRVQLLSAVGIGFFQDVLSLEPGDRWQQRIELGIDECDLFLLFWSSEAKQSEWVRREVQHALARKHEDDLSPPEIRPIVIEGPPIVEPWEELADLHFNDRLLYFIGT